MVPESILRATGRENTSAFAITLRDLGGEKRVVGGQITNIMKKPNMFRVLVTTVSMAAFALASAPTFGQQTPAAAPSGGAVVTASLDEHLKVEGHAIYLKLPGQAWDRGSAPATMGHAIKALRTLYPNATFAIDPRVAEVPVTDLIIRSDDPMTDLEALRTSCGGRFSIVHDPNFASASGVAEQNPLYSIIYNNATDIKPPAGEDRQIECFNLTGYLQREKALDKDEANTNKGPAAAAQAADLASDHAAMAIGRLRDMIQESITAFDPSISQPHFQFYADAQLLIVIGSHRSIQVAAKVINALPGQQTWGGNGWGGGNYFGQQRDAQQIKAEDALLRSQLLQGAVSPQTDDNSNNANKP